jgi:ABC-type transport system involved in multi-copper enzyme maturation permease subunit
MVLIPSISTFYISQKLGNGKFFLIGDAIEGQYVANNLHFAAAIAFILMITTLGVACSFLPAVKKFDVSYDAGMYLIYIFSITIASMADFSTLNLQSGAGLLGFMAVAVFVCLFISDDFRSGYAKNLFTVRAKRGEYVISKTLAGVVCGALMLVAYLLGSILGGAIAGLSFDLHGLGAGNLVACMLAKICLMPVFVSIFTLISVAAKQRAWLSICGSLGGGMLLFMMVSVVTPLGSTILNVALCAAGGALFGLGLGAISRVVLRRSGLV